VAKDLLPSAPPAWRALAVLPLGVLLAWIVGWAQHQLLAGELASFLARLQTVYAQQGTLPAPGGLALAAAAAAADMCALGIAYDAFVRGLGRYRQAVAGFPWGPLAWLVCLNLLCWACLQVLGAVATWATVLGLVLTVMVGGG
jgi:hypothetical protein